jgi:hypothetical protein
MSFNYVVTRVQSEGAIRVMFDIMIKDMKRFGFEPQRKDHNQRSISIDHDAMHGDYSSMIDQPLSRRIA